MITARRLRPCLLYTPPVAPTDLDGLASCPDLGSRDLGEAPRACPSGGRRSRNKAAVGEPAAGSFQHFFRQTHGGNCMTVAPSVLTESTDTSRPLGSNVDEERSTERDWWRGVTALCESSLFEFHRGTWQIAERLHLARTDAVCSRNQVSLPSAM